MLLQMPNPQKPLEQRDIAAIGRLYDSGARAQELCDIPLKDILFGNPTNVLWHGKGGKSHIVPLMSHPTKLLRQFIAERKIETAEKNTPHF